MCCLPQCNGFSAVPSNVSGIVFPTRDIEMNEYKLMAVFYKYLVSVSVKGNVIVFICPIVLQTALVQPLNYRGAWMLERKNVTAYN